MHALCICCRAVLQGSMTALTPSLRGYGADGQRHCLTPPPPHILPRAAVEAAQVRPLAGRRFA